MPKDGRSDEDLKREASKLHGIKHAFMGVFSKDTMPVLRNNQTAVINLQNETDSNGNPLPGTHWVSAGILNNQPWYFDSFGLGVPKEIAQALHAPESRIMHGHHQLQDDRSNFCGDFALAAANAIMSQPNQSAHATMHQFNHYLNVPNLQKNDNRIEHLLKREARHRSAHGIQYESYLSGVV